MGKFHFQNSSAASVELIIEPFADRYALDAGQSVEIACDGLGDLPLEIVYHSSANLAVWTHGPTEVFSDGELLAPM